MGLFFIGSHLFFKYHDLIYSLLTDVLFYQYSHKLPVYTYIRSKVIIWSSSIVGEEGLYGRITDITRVKIIDKLVSELGYSIF